MIGVILVLMAAGMLFLVISLDVFFVLFESWDAGGLRRIVTQSSNHNLLLYELPFLILIIGVPLLVQETQNPLLQDIFPTIWIQIGAWIPTILISASLNIVRFERLGLDRRHEKSVYLLAEELVEKGATPEEGLDEGLAYIRSTESNFRTVSERRFLQYLLSRNDIISENAAKKLGELT